MELRNAIRYEYKTVLEDTNDRSIQLTGIKGLEVAQFQWIHTPLENF
jgi:hypothetical protein